MSSKQELKDRIDQILLSDAPYAREAYEWIADAVGFAVSRVGSVRHVRALELLEGVREFATSEYGFLARQVLTGWGISGARDVGRIVYQLIEVGALSASPEDDPSEFEIEFELFPDEPELPPLQPFVKIDG